MIAIGAVDLVFGVVLPPIAAALAVYLAARRIAETAQGGPPLSPLAERRCRYLAVFVLGLGYVLGAFWEVADSRDTRLWASILAWGILLALFAKWRSYLRRRPYGDGFPSAFRPQRIGIRSAIALAQLPRSEISKYFRENPGVAQVLLGESGDKRHTPSTFITENADGSFKVGWYSGKRSYESVRNFQHLADAATDYLLFSLGEGRWTPSS